MSRQSEEVKINRAVKAIKWGGAALFFAVNLYLGFRFFSAYGDGQMRGEALHEQREAKRKKQGLKKQVHKSLMPEQLQPEFIEKQVRKYKQISQSDKREQK